MFFTRDKWTTIGEGKSGCGYLSCPRMCLLFCCFLFLCFFLFIHNLHTLPSPPLSLFALHVSRLMLRPKRAYSSTLSWFMSSLVVPILSSRADTSSSIWVVDVASISWACGSGRWKKASPILYLYMREGRRYVSSQSVGLFFSIFFFLLGYRIAMSNRQGKHTALCRPHPPTRAPW